MKEGLLPTDAVSVCKSFPVELSDSEGGGCEGRGEAPGHPLLLHTRPDTRHQGEALVITADTGRCWYLHFGAEQLQPPAPGQSQHVGEVAAGGDGDVLQPPRHPGPVQVEAGRLN